MLGSVLVYCGLILAIAGGVSLIRPMRILRIRTRAAGAGVLLGGLVVAAAGFALPSPEKRSPVPSTRLDEIVPVWQFDERHEIRVDAEPQRAFEAIRSVTAGEIALFRTLTAIRRAGRRGPESILDAPERLPILDVATRTTFIVLADEPPREIVVGTVIIAPPGARPGDRLTPDAFRHPPPGIALAAMNFVVTPDGGGSLVSTETRVHAGGAAAHRRFKTYWRIILPGSDIIRRMWLRAIKRRAEAAP